MSFRGAGGAGARPLTHAFAATTTAIGFLAEPIPGLDEAVIIPMQYALAALIAKARSRKISSVPWGRVTLIIWGGAGLRLVAETTSRVIPLVPVVGPAANAVLTLLSTELLGSFVDRALVTGPLSSPGLP